LRTKIKLQAGAKRFKQRLFSKPTNEPVLSNGDSCIFFYNSFRFDLIYMRLLRQSIKRSVKKFKRLSLSRRVWLSLRPAYPISKKSKNARMGKGHGSFFRWAIRLYPNIPFISFRGISKYSLLIVLRRIRFLFSIHPYLLSSQSKSTSLLGRSIRWGNSPINGSLY
jgi:ribosomal protein L16/L10AE